MGSSGPWGGAEVAAVLESGARRHVSRSPGTEPWYRHRRVTRWSQTQLGADGLARWAHSARVAGRPPRRSAGSVSRAGSWPARRPPRYGLYRTAESERAVVDERGASAGRSGPEGRAGGDDARSRRRGPAAIGHDHASRRPGCQGAGELAAHPRRAAGRGRRAAPEPDSRRAPAGPRVLPVRRALLRRSMGAARLRSGRRHPASRFRSGGRAAAGGALPRRRSYQPSLSVNSNVRSTSARRASTGKSRDSSSASEIWRPRPPGCAASAVGGQTP